MQHNIQLLEQSKESFIHLKRAKQYLRIDHHQDDETIADMIDIALCAAQSYLGMQLKFSLWKLTLYDYLPTVIKLPHPPIIKLESFKLYKHNQEELFLGSQYYSLNQFAEQIKLKTQFSMQRAEIIYRTGYESIWLPAPIRQGMLEHIAKMYDLRGDDQGMPLGAKSLYQPYKRVRL